MLRPERTRAPRERAALAAARVAGREIARRGREGAKEGSPVAKRARRRSDPPAVPFPEFLNRSVPEFQTHWSKCERKGDDDMVSGAAEEEEGVSLWAKVKWLSRNFGWLAFQRIGCVHAFLAAVSVVAAAAQYADLCRWQEQRDELRLCVQQAADEGGISEKCARIYGDIMLDSAQ